MNANGLSRLLIICIIRLQKILCRPNLEYLWKLIWKFNQIRHTQRERQRERLERDQRERERLERERENREERIEKREERIEKREERIEKREERIEKRDRQTDRQTEFCGPKVFGDPYCFSRFNVATTVAQSIKIHFCSLHIGTSISTYRKMYLY